LEHLEQQPSAAVPHSLCLIEPDGKVFLQRRVQFTHLGRLVGEPEFPHVFLTPLVWGTKPRVAEPFEAVPSHSYLVEPELRKTRIEPIVSQITIQVGRALTRVKNETRFFSHKLSQVGGDIRMQINLPVRKFGLELVGDAGAILLHLLLHDDTTMVRHSWRKFRAYQIVCMTLA